VDLESLICKLELTSLVESMALTDSLVFDAPENNDYLGDRNTSNASGIRHGKESY
jgi:hypothetical protein